MIESREPDSPAQSHRVYILPGWVRAWHWTNALLILTLIVTGISLHFADDKLLLIEFSLAVRIHNIAGVLLVALYAFFVIANAVTGNWWQFVPRPPGVLKRCMAIQRYYVLGVFKGEPEPFQVTREENFNPMQAITYWIIMYLVLPVVIVTGLIFLYPQAAPTELFGMDGLLPIAMLHYLSGAIIVVFLVAHIYLCTFGKKVSSTFKTMITGWHEH